MDTSYTPQQFTVNFNVRCETRPGDKVILVGDRKELGAWTPSAAIQCVTTPKSYPSWTVAAPVGAAGFIQFKFVILHADGSCTWEYGSNRIRHITRSESMPCGKFIKNVYDASMRQALDAFADHQRYFEVFASPTEVHALEDRVESLQERIGTMAATNSKLTEELMEAQYRLAQAEKEKAKAAAAAATPFASPATKSSGAVEAPLAPRNPVQLLRASGSISSKKAASPVPPVRADKENGNFSVVL